MLLFAVALELWQRPLPFTFAATLLRLPELLLEVMPFAAKKEKSHYYYT